MSARRSWIRWGGVGAALCALSLLSCKDAVMEPLTVAAVEVAGGGVNLRLGQTAQLTPTLKSTKGYVLPKVGISWSSSDGAKASISSSGQVTAVSRGPVTLTASAGGVNGTAAVTVIGVQSIALSPETLSVIVTQTRAMTATTVLDPGVTVTPTWRSLDTTIARVGTDGRVTATSTTGIARIEVTAEDKKDTAVVRVVPVPVVSVVVSPDTATRTVGQTLQLTATPKDSIGGTLTGRVVTWSSSDTSKVTISSTGLATAKAVGNATITVMCEGKAGTTMITILVPVATVSVSPTTASVVAGGTQQVTATLRDAGGTVLTGRTVTWNSSNTATATVSSTGLVRAIAAGISTITANSEGKSSTVAVTVTRSANTVISNYPFDGSLASLGELGPAVAAFTPTYVIDRFARAGRAIELIFSSAIQQNLSIGEIRHSGAVTLATWLKIPSASFISMTLLIAHQPGAGLALQIYRCGSFNTTCKTAGTGYLGFASNWSGDNLSAPANRLVDTTTAISAGEWNHLAVTMDSEGTATLYVNGKSVATRAGMSVPAYTATSAVIGPCEGYPCTAHLDDFQIIAGAVSASVIASWATDRPPVATVTLSPTVATLLTNTTQQLTATLMDSVGGTLTGRTVAWSSSDTSKATVSSTGLVTAKAAGSTTITAASEGKTGSVTLAIIGTSKVLTGGDYSCSIMTNGTLRCWGSGWVNRINGFSPDSALSVFRGTTWEKEEWVSVSTGYEHACGIQQGGVAYCWGKTRFGQLGTGDDGTGVEFRFVPTPVSGDVRWLEIRAGIYQTCGISSPSRALYCWGAEGTSGSEGPVVGTGSLTPTLVDATIPHETLSLGGSQACTMHNISKAWYCIGRIGAESFSSPQLVSFSGINAVQAVAVGQSSVCGIATDGRGYCFGSGFGGSLASPIGPLANVSNWRRFENGLAQHFCGIDADNNGHCWGRNNSGQIGDGTAIDRSAPTKISGTWSQLLPALGTRGGGTGDHTCGLSTAGSVYCWGFGEGYQLGNGSATSIVLRPEKKVKNLP